MSDSMTFGEALVAMEKGDRCRAGDITYAIEDGQLSWLSSDGHWVESDPNIEYLRKQKWFRVLPPPLVEYPIELWQAVKIMQCGRVVAFVEGLVPRMYYRIHERTIQESLSTYGPWKRCENLPVNGSGMTWVSSTPSAPEPDVAKQIREAVAAERKRCAEMASSAIMADVCIEVPS